MTPRLTRSNLYLALVAPRIRNISCHLLPPAAARMTPLPPAPRAALQDSSLLGGREAAEANPVEDSDEEEDWAINRRSLAPSAAASRRGRPPPVSDAASTSHNSVQFFMNGCWLSSFSLSVALAAVVAATATAAAAAAALPWSLSHRPFQAAVAAVVVVAFVFAFVVVGGGAERKGLWSDGRGRAATTELSFFRSPRLLLLPEGERQIDVLRIDPSSPPRPRRSCVCRRSRSRSFLFS